jgi:hypothetical protein
MKGKQYNKTYKVRPGYASFLDSQWTSLIFVYAVAGSKRLPRSDQQQPRPGALFQFGRSVRSKQVVGLFIQLVVKEQSYNENESNEGEYSK